MIDILARLQEKTKGNLSDEESQLVAKLLFELRIALCRGDAGQEADHHVVSPCLDILKARILHK